MKKKYEIPEIDIKEIEKIDVITVSNEDSDDIEFVPDENFW